MSLCLHEIYREKARLEAVVRVAFEGEFDDCVACIDETMLRFVRYDDGDSYRVLHESPCTIRFRNYVERLWRMQSVMGVDAHIHFYMDALFALLLSPVQFEMPRVESRWESKLIQLCAAVTRQLPNCSDALCNYWNEVLRLSPIPLHAMHQMLWDEKEYELVLRYTNVMSEKELMDALELRLEGEDVQRVVSQLERYEMHVVNRVRPYYHYPFQHMIHDLFLHLLHCSLPRIASIRDVLPLIDFFSSEQLRMDAIALVTDYYNLRDYDDILWLHNTYSDLYNIWDADYFSLLLTYHGHTRIQHLTSVNTLQMEQILKFANNCVVDASLKEFVLRHMDVVMEIESRVVRVIAQNAWLRRAYLEKKRSGDVVSVTRDYRSAYCYVEAMIAHYCGELSYDNFRAMMRFVDSCMVRDENDGMTLDTHILYSLMFDTPRLPHVVRITPYYYTQYRHRHSLYANEYEHVIEKKERVILRVLRNKIPEDVIRYMMQWL